MPNSLRAPTAEHPGSLYEQPDNKVRQPVAHVAVVRLFGNDVTLPQVVTIVMTLASLLSIYFGVIGKLDRLDQQQVELKSNISRSVDKLSTSFIDIERRVNELEKETATLKQADANVSKWSDRMEQEFSSLESFIRDQFAILRRDQDR